jgi:GH24 family phage-related lysozyme (muramidase)
MLLQKRHAGQHAEVLEQRQCWHRAGGKVLKGRERRREAEAALEERRWYALTLRVHCGDKRLL